MELCERRTVTNAVRGRAVTNVVRERAVINVVRVRAITDVVRTCSLIMKNLDPSRAEKIFIR